MRRSFSNERLGEASLLYEERDKGYYLNAMLSKDKGYLIISSHSRDQSKVGAIKQNGDERIEWIVKEK